MTVGDIIDAGTPPIPEVFPGKMGPTTAMKEALAAYLLNAMFRVDGGADVRDSEFNLSGVLSRFPRADEDLIYPCASIQEIDNTERDLAMTPAPLENTIGLHDALIGHSGEPPATCLWCSGEANVSLQLDFWCNTEADREAIEGELAYIFEPDEGRGGVVVEGPELYFGQDCEFALVSHRNDDTGLRSQRNEYRLRCVVDANCAIVSLRRATLISSIRAVVTAIDPVDPGEEEEEDS